MKSYVLVSCGKEKLDRPAPAKDLYTSQLFRKSREWAERSGHPWFILSAKHGLVHPDTVLEPYDLTLNDFNAQELQDWSRKVAKQLVQFYHRGDLLTVLAGEKYLSFIEQIPDLVFPNPGWKNVYQPMKGLQIGERLAWLTKANASMRESRANRLCPIRWRV